MKQCSAACRNLFFVIIFLLSTCFILSSAFAEETDIAWHKVGFQAGGTVVDLAAVPDSKTVFAIIFGAGLYQSNDNGSTWQLLNPAWASAQQLIYFKNILYLVDRSGDLYASKDQGETWRVISQNIETTQTNKLVDDGASLYLVNTHDGHIYKRSEADNSWEVLNLLGDHISAISIVSVDHVLYAGTNADGVYASLDEGKTWKKISTVLLDHFSIDQLVYHKGALYARHINYDFLGKNVVLQSTDSGKSWINVTPSGIVGTISSDLSVINGDLYLCMKNMSKGGIYKTTDGGASWTMLNKGLDFRSVNKVAATQTGLLAATDGAIYSMPNDQDSWVASSTGLNSINIVSVFNTKAGTLLALSNVGVCYRSTDAGKTWMKSENFHISPLSVSRAFSEDDGGHIYLVLYKALLRSDDQGKSWVSLALPTPPDKLSNPLTPTSLYVHDNVLYLGILEYGVYRSLDFGQTWQLFITPPFITSVDPVFDMAIVGENFYLGTDFSVFVASSVNGGRMKFLDKAPKMPVFCVVVAHDTALYICTKNGVYKTMNGGATWTPLSVSAMKSVSQLVVDGQTLYAASIENGIFKSSDDGVNWTPQNTGLEPSLHASTLIKTTDTLYTGTFSGLFSKATN